MRLPPVLLALTLAAGCNPARGVPIFLWHAVGEGSPQDLYDVPAAEFEDELRTLERFGVTTVSLDQLIDARTGGAPLPERAVVLTFDDARACLRTAAMPLLLAHKMSAEVFVVTSWTGEDDAHRHVVEDDTGRHPYLTWPELAEMVQSGAFRVQSHSVTHRHPSKLSREELAAEIVDSRRILTERLGVPVNFFAYPLGASSSAWRDEAERAGLRGALTVEKGLGTRFAMKRQSLLRENAGVLTEVLTATFGAPKP